MATSFQVTFDCTDPDRLATFWAEALGYQKQGPPDGFGSWEEFLTTNNVPEAQWGDFSAIVDPDRRGPRCFFQRVPEPKTVKNRLHLDVNVGGGPGTPAAKCRQRVDAALCRASRQ